MCVVGTWFAMLGGDFHLLFHYFGLGEKDHGDHGGHAHASASGDDWEFTIGHAWNLTVTPMVIYTHRIFNDSYMATYMSIYYPYDSKTIPCSL